jgi:1-acyl-sn-glycerol-3-phosphate acyltransferase
LVSPVFFSTLRDGSIVRGLSGIPDDRPMLFVGNHQTFALDLGLFVEQILRERGILLRGLAHPAIFSVRALPVHFLFLSDE